MSKQITSRGSARAGRRSERGQSLVEMALSLIFLVWLIAVIVDAGSALFTWIALRDAAQEGALYGSVNPTDNLGIKTRVVTASNRPVDLQKAYVVDGTLDINVSTDRQNTCTGGWVQVDLYYRYTPLIPLVNAIWNPIKIHAAVRDTVLLPACP